MARWPPPEAYSETAKRTGSCWADLDVMLVWTEGSNSLKTSGCGFSPLLAKSCKSCGGCEAILRRGGRASNQGCPPSIRSFRGTSQGTLKRRRMSEEFSNPNLCSTCLGKIGNGGHLKNWCGRTARRSLVGSEDTRAYTTARNVVLSPNSSKSRTDHELLRLSDSCKP